MESVHKVLVLDDDEDLCELLCELLAFKTNATCLVAHSVDEMKAKASEVLDCVLALLDVNLGYDMPSGLDAHAWLKQHHFGGRVVFLTGHARKHPDLEQAQTGNGVRVLEKPIGSDVLVSLVSAATEVKPASP